MTDNQEKDGSDITIVLEGTVGSRAYGLDHKNNDTETLGVYLAPIHCFLGLNGYRPVPTFRNHKPDWTIHEAGKFLQLALSANPTVTELLWLENHTVLTTAGQALIDIRTGLLSADAVRNAYFGYATSQSRTALLWHHHKIKEMTAKNARHLLRLLEQGQQLYAHGSLTVRLNNPEQVWDTAERIAHGDVGLLQTTLDTAREFFQDTESVLPEEPDTEKANETLVGLRLSPAAS